jgi:hypothetical protein
MKQNIIKIGILIILITSLCQSCAISALPSEPVAFTKETAKKGLIIGTVTFPKEKARFQGYFFRVVLKGNDSKKTKKKTIEFKIIPEQIFKMKHCGEVDKGLTYLFAIERPEGDYEMSSIRLFKNNGFFTQNYYINSFSIPFNVKKGEIVYVGNILFNEHMDKNDKTVKLVNNFEKDIKVFQQFQPMTDWQTVIDRKEYIINYSR